ncbi:hypothetical protein BCGT_3996 [Mycobacterium tuberculosis variant bovis BCG str. ATCC 35743]|nr:hypothetical protein BCGT_3996 [Mycobacterium tuberculosis variant bovis BCG str. ATCC 35743]AKQ99750.1 hypothetical protein Mb1595_p0228 [Mycobacterium tuberculosis variant bovis]ALA76544.1 Uncharacterized protein BCGR_0226 [Mycobacterium tuberculosis variant bovis BCG]AOZ41236.1 hypothetical protein BTB1458_0223 [Mycobacterium tuberculosis]
MSAGTVSIVTDWVGIAERQSRTHVRGQKPLIRQINHNRRDPAPGQLATHSVAW